MRILCCIALFVALSGGVELKQTRETFVERIDRMEAGMHRMSLQFNYLVKSVARISKHMKMETDENKPEPTNNKTEINAHARLMNDTDLEERVSVLEMQMVGVLNDIETIEGDQSVQDYRLDEAEGEIEAIQTDVTSIQETITVLVANDETMQSSIADLEQTDQDLVSEIDELSTTVDSQVDSLDSRLSQLQVDGTFAFHAYVGSYSTIPVNTIVVYDNVIINQGNGYNSGTGVFTVPTGGAGLYYFFAHFAFDHNRGDFASFGIRKNGAVLALAFNDDIPGSGDTGSSSCGAITILAEGTSNSHVFPILVLYLAELDELD